MAHIVKRCSRCRRRVSAGERVCACGGRRIVWLARYVDPDGQEKAQTFERQQDAEDFLEGIEADKNEGRYIDPKAGRETLGSIYARFGADVELEPTTRSKWGTVWRKHIELRLGSTSVSRITKNAIIATRDAPTSPWQGNEALKLTKRLLYFAVDDGILTRNVASRIKPRETKREKIEILEPAELTAVLDHLGDRWRAMVLLDALGSLRWSELVGLRRQDLDLEARTVTVRQKITEVNGTFHVGRPKTEESARTVDLPAVVVKPLAEYLLRYPASPEGLIFHGANGNPVRRKVFRAAWLKALENAKIKKHVRPGWLRHSGASLAYAASHDLKLVSKRLGHTSTRMVDSTYVSLYEDASRAVADAIDELLRASAARETDH
jgi:integrase